jgi:hypothetical protein
MDDGYTDFEPCCGADKRGHALLPFDILHTGNKAKAGDRNSYSSADFTNCISCLQSP